MSNTIYSQEYHTVNPVRTPLNASYNNTIQSLSQNNSHGIKNSKMTKKEQLRQINSIIRQKINYMTNQFTTIQKSSVKNTGLGRTVGQRLLVQRENSLHHQNLKNTISTQLDQNQPEQFILTYDSCILLQKNMKQKILNAYELIQKYQNANQDYRLNIQLEEYDKFQQTKGIQNKKSPIYQNNKRSLQYNQLIQSKQYLKPSYISYADQLPSQRKIQEQAYIKDKNPSYQQIADVSNQNKIKPQKFKNTVDKVNKTLYKAIQNRIVASCCTYNVIPMNKDKSKVQNIIARMNKQTIQRESLIDQLRKDHKKN